jgi:hypothetical protein
MSVYRLVALVADLNTLPCVNTQGYQTIDAFATEVANHFSPFLALATHKKGGIPRHTGQEYPLQKSTKRRLPPPHCAWLFSVKRSRLLLRALSFGYAFASASSRLLLPLSVQPHLLVLRRSARLRVQVQLRLSLCRPVPSAH